MPLVVISFKDGEVFHADVADLSFDLAVLAAELRAVVPQRHIAARCWLACAVPATSSEPILVTATLAPIEPATPDVPPSLTSRFFTRRTVASLIAAGVLVAFAVARAPINWGEAWRNIRGANPLLYLTALVVFYSTFLIRAVRWRVLLRNAGEDQPALPLAGISVT